jgi:hypothetical protein
MVHYSVLNSSQLDSTMSQMNPVHNFSFFIFLRSVLKIFSHLLLELKRGPLNSGFRKKKLYQILMSLMCGIFPARTLLVLITLILFAKVYRLRSFSFLSPPSSGYLPSLSSRYYRQQTFSQNLTYVLSM